MISRTTATIDRLAALVLGVLIVAAAALVAARSIGPLSQWTERTIGGDRLELGGLRSVTDDLWWPWALAGFGVLAILLALRWLAAHIGRIRPAPLRWIGSAGPVTMAPSTLADGAADALESEENAVDSVRAITLVDRGVPTLELRVNVASPEVVSDVARATDRTLRTAAAMLGDTGTLAMRATLHVPGPRRSHRTLR